MPTTSEKAAPLNSKTQKNVDVSAEAEKVNFAVDTYLTNDAWAAAVRWSQPVVRDKFLSLGINNGDDYEDVRLWDVLFMAKTGASRAVMNLHQRTPDRPVCAPFKVSVVPDTTAADTARELTLFLRLSWEGLVIHTTDALP